MKKTLTIILVAVMLVVMAAGVFAADDSEKITCTGFWSDWTHSYEITDEPLVLDIEHKSHGTDNYDGIVAVFTSVYCDGEGDPALTTDGYAEYGVFRGDSWGWNYSDGGSAVFTSTLTDQNGNGDVWDDYRATMTSCNIVATFEKTATGFKFSYDVEGDNDVDFLYTAEYNCNTSNGLYVFFTGEECEYTVAPHTEKDPGETDAPETDAPETDAPETEAPETDAPVTEKPEIVKPEGDAPGPNAEGVPEDYIAYFSFDNTGHGLWGGGAVALPNNKAVDGNAQVVIDNAEMYAGEGSLRLCNADPATLYWLEVWKEDGSSLLTGLHDVTISFWSNTNGVGPSWTFFATPRFDGQPWLQIYRQELYIGLLENASIVAQRFCVPGAENGETKDRTPELVGEYSYNEWKQVTVTFNDTCYTLYINGEWWGEYALHDTTLVDLLGDDSIFYIGASTWANGVIAGENFVDGYVDEFYVYPRCMSEEEVIDFYVAQGGKAPDGYYDSETEDTEDTETPDTKAPETDAPGTDAPTTDAPAEEKGCGSAMGAAAIVALVATFGCAVIKKK